MTPEDQSAPRGIRSRLRSGEVVFGTLAFEFHTYGLPDIVGAAGGDFVVLDLEATSLSMDRLGGVLRAARRTGVATIVRVPEITKTHVSRSLDAGAAGVMAPLVESGAAAERMSSLALYPPEGIRGAAFGISHDNYSTSDPNETMRRANLSTILIAQIESVAGIEQSRDIGSNEHVDVLWIGHNDLLNSLGLPNDRTHPTFVEAVDTVREACLVTGTALGGLASSPEDVRLMVEFGYRCISVMSDVRLFQQSLSAGIEAGKRAIK